MLQDGKFWPARLNSTKLPDVYGVVMDRQRGNRPIILPRDDILKEAVCENFSSTTIILSKVPQNRKTERQFRVKCLSQNLDFKIPY